MSITKLLCAVAREMAGSLLLPLFKRALESGDPKAQEEALRKLNALSELLDYGPLREQVMPHVHVLALTTVTAKVRINALVLMGALVRRLDTDEAEKMLHTTMQVG